MEEDAESLKKELIFLTDLLRNHEIFTKQQAYLQNTCGNQRTFGGQVNYYYSKSKSSYHYKKKSNVYKINPNAKFEHSNSQYSSCNKTKLQPRVLLKNNSVSSVVTHNQNLHSKSVVVNSKNQFRILNSVPKLPTANSLQSERSLKKVKSKEMKKFDKLVSPTLNKEMSRSEIGLLPTKLYGLLEIKKDLNVNPSLCGSNALQNQRSHIADELIKSRNTIQKLNNQILAKNNEKTSLENLEISNLKNSCMPHFVTKNSKCVEKIRHERGTLSPCLDSKSQSLGSVEAPASNLAPMEVSEHKCGTEIGNKIKLDRFKEQPIADNFVLSDGSKASPVNDRAVIKNVSRPNESYHSLKKPHFAETKAMKSKKMKLLPSKVCHSNLSCKKSIYSMVNLSSNCLKKANKSPRCKAKSPSKFVFKMCNGKANSKYIYVAKPLPVNLNSSKLILKKKDVSQRTKTGNGIVKNVNCGLSNVSALTNKSFTTLLHEKKKCKLFKGKYQLVNKSLSDTAMTSKYTQLTKTPCSTTKGKSKLKMCVPGEKGIVKCLYNVPKFTHTENFHELTFIKTSDHKPKRSLISKYKLSNFTPGKSSFQRSHALQNRWRSESIGSSKYRFVNKRPNHANDVVKMIKAKYNIVGKKSPSNSHLMKWSCNSLKMKIRSTTNFNGRKTKNWPTRHSYVVSPKHKKKYLTSPKKSLKKYEPDQNKKLVKIGGTKYKVSKTKVIKASNTPRRISRVVRRFNTSNGRSPVVHGSKFRTNGNEKSLTRLANERNKNNRTSLRRINISGVSYIQTRPGCLKKSPSAQTRNLASRVLNRSIHTVWAASAKKNTKRNDSYCMFYNRFGRCNKGDECTYIHDPSKVAICSRFLRGTCKIEGCPFSHEVTEDKMPICSFFMRGICTKSDCPYKHITIEPGTKLCKAFVKGYCHSGNQCKNAHIFACPQFICEGYCEKKASCTWPHPPLKATRKMDSTEIPQKSKRICDDEAARRDVIEQDDSRYFVLQKHGFLSQKCNNLASPGNVENEAKCELPREAVAKTPHTCALTKFCVQPEFIPLSFSDDEE